MKGQDAAYALAPQGAGAASALRGAAEGLLNTPVRLQLVEATSQPPRLELQRGGLGLGEAARYAEPALSTYRVALQRLAQQAGEPDPVQAAQRLLNLERRLASRWVAARRRALRTSA